MARPKQVKARKDYPQHGIKRGDVHWFVRIKTGPYSSREMRQIAPFRQSQLTSSEYLAAIYDWQDSLDALESVEDAQLLVDEIREIGEQQREKLENMPEGLQEGDTGQMLQERADACEEAANQIEQFMSEAENADEEDDETDWLEEIKSVSVG